MAADGSIIIDTRINTGGFDKGAASLKSQFAGLGSSVKKLGGLIAAAFSVRQIIAFGKEAIALGSDLQEVQNVVDVTFTTMNEQINEFAQNAAKTAGLSETMAKRYAGTFGAMAKSFKFTEEEAFNMSTALTQLTGDVASFYNLTQDEAYTKLKSVFTGETESLKDLGVVMTQTALDDFALRKGLKKTTSQMTEQEKVALRYQFVLEQMNGASGDFLRTSDSWANQTRLLSLQFDSLKATIGQGLINALTPAIKVLNEMIASFQVLANSFLEFTEAVFGEAGSASQAITETAQSAEALGNNVEEAGKKAKKALAPFDEIAKISGTNETEMSTASASIVANDVTIGENVQDNVSPAIDRISQNLQDLIAPLQEIDFKPVMDQVSTLGGVFKRLGKVVEDSLSWAWFDILVPLSVWTIEDFAPASVEMLKNALDVLAVAGEIVLDSIKSLWEYLEPAFMWLGDVAVLCVDLVSQHFADMAQTLGAKSQKIKEIFSGLGEIFLALWNLIRPFLDNLVEYWRATTKNLSDNLAEEIAIIIDILHGLIEFIAGVFTGDTKRAFDGFGEMMAGLVNLVIGLINKMISAIVEGINYTIRGINSLSFTVPDWVPGIGGESIGFKIPTIKAPQIPYLASGAVIPPNAPFMAVLGDQRHGTNIEAPLETIQEAVAAVMADFHAGNMAGHEATVAILREMLEAVLGIEIGDSVIGEAVERYKRKTAALKGGT